MDMHYTATAVLFNPEGQVLLLFHHKFGRWMCPGGHIEPGETPDAAMLREVREETGLAATILSPTPQVKDAHAFALTTPLCVLHEWITPEHVHIDLVYKCLAKDPGALRVNPREAREARWFDTGEVLDWPEDKTYQNIRQVIALALAS